MFGLLVLGAYFAGTTVPFLGPDEPRYAQVAREMLERGDWITPTLGGHNWFEKPPLLYWLEIVSFNLFGISEFSARLGSILCGLGIAVALWFLGRNVIVSRRPDRELGYWLAIVSLSTLSVIAFSHGASTDIVLTFTITAALVSFFIFDQRSQNQERNGTSAFPLILFYVFIGLSLLAKGLIGMILPFAIIGAFYLLSRRLPNRTFILSLLWGTILAAALAAVWYVPMYQRHGQEFIDEFFVQHHFERFASNKFQHPQPFYFYFLIVPLMTLPWLPLFFAAVWKYLKGTFRGAMLSPLLTFSVAWLIVPVIFFSLSGSKLPGYVLPAIPGSIILTSVFVFEVAQKSNAARKGILITAASTLFISVAILLFALPRFADSDSVKRLIETADAHGHGTEPVIALHGASHSAEFYAAGRMIRDADGKQRIFDDLSEVVKQVRSVLVLVPLKDISQATPSKDVSTEIIAENGELAIVSVR
jgi:4-amino-4-deoxy-L-arabinose transferase-like glycosyltransferase